MKKNFYITTPIYYVNDKPHIGHAYTSLACDVIARSKRLENYNVYFLTGTDEHGQKVENSSLKVNQSPQQFVDRISENFKDLCLKFNFSNDQFIRTTENRHKLSSQKLWKLIYENGHIYKDFYSGWYAVRDEAFYNEKELINGKAPTGADVEWLEEPSYFFDLSKWKDPLLNFYKNNPNFVMPESRYNEVKSFVSLGLNDLSISRTSFNWGVKVPDDSSHIMYVWLDALTNYLTALNFHDNEVNDIDFWPPDIHMVGKDILRFHAVYWPAFLMAAKLPLPKKIFAHGWWTNEGKKISKSIGNIIDPFILADEYGLDQVRYFLLRQVPFGNDGDFSRNALISRINDDLSNDLGNLCQRVLKFIFKNCNSKLPSKPKVLEKNERLIINNCNLMHKKMISHLDDQNFDRALKEVWKIISDSNKFIDLSEPWKLKTTNPDKMEDILWVLVELIRKIAIVLQPFMPNSSCKILDQLSIPEDERDYDSFKNNYVKSAEIKIPEAVFPKYILNE